MVPPSLYPAGMLAITFLWEADSVPGPAVLTTGLLLASQVTVICFPETSTPSRAKQRHVLPASRVLKQESMSKRPEES